MQGFDFDELFLRYRYSLLLVLVGLILIGVGIFVFRSGLNSNNTKVEVLSGEDAGNTSENIIAEISGEIIKPGVYKLMRGSRIEDLVVMSGGFTADADRVWVDKYLNRAAKINDGQKVYIPKSGEQSKVISANNLGGDQTISSTFSSDSNSLININNASLSQLDSLPGIGQVYGQNIIDHRPYSNVEELLSKGVLKKSVYEKIKDMVSIY